MGRQHVSRSCKCLSFRLQYFSLVLMIMVLVRGYLIHWCVVSFSGFILIKCISKDSGVASSENVESVATVYHVSVILY